jgi:hypothetical protein
MRNLFITNYNKEPKGFVEGRISMETFLEERCVASAEMGGGSLRLSALMRETSAPCFDLNPLLFALHPCSRRGLEHASTTFSI